MAGVKTYNREFSRVTSRTVVAYHPENPYRPFDLDRATARTSAERRS
jgi:hypothetical protein